MTAALGGAAGDALASVCVNVVPSLAGAQDAMVAGVDHADVVRS
jgi:hypothetical protein